MQCCRSGDTGGQGGLGEWYFPDGRIIQTNISAQSQADGQVFYLYIVRNAPQVVSLAHRQLGDPYVQTGTYCCVIQTTGGEMTFCANIGECAMLR